MLFFFPAARSEHAKSELLAIQKQISTLREYNVEVIAITTDTQESLLEWGLEQLEFPIIADYEGTVC